MATMPPGHGYELDPNKAAGQDIEQNQENVKLVVMFSDCPIGYVCFDHSTVQCYFEVLYPLWLIVIHRMFREICMHIAKSV
jgi:hypothetical protein